MARVLPLIAVPMNWMKKALMIADIRIVTMTSISVKPVGNPPRPPFGKEGSKEVFGKGGSKEAFAEGGRAEAIAQGGSAAVGRTAYFHAEDPRLLAATVPPPLSKGGGGILLSRASSII
jgi:hypothetical protein